MFDRFHMHFKNEWMIRGDELHFYFQFNFPNYKECPLKIELTLKEKRRSPNESSIDFGDNFQVYY